MLPSRRSTYLRSTTLLGTFAFTLVTILYFLSHQSAQHGPSVVVIGQQQQSLTDNSTQSSVLSNNFSTGETEVPKAQEEDASSESKPEGAALMMTTMPSAPPPTARRPPLTVVCVSDTHGLYAQEGLLKVPEADMLLFAGDAEVGSPAEGVAFSRWLAGLPVRGPRVVTWGNMDTGTDMQGVGAVLVPAATLIVDSIMEVAGYRIFASPWTPRFAGAYQLDAEGEALDRFWAQLLPPNADVDIILTHGPPYGIADKARGQHRGDVGLLRAVQALQKPPLLWVCGHVHEQYGSHAVPHPAAPGGAVPLINSAVFYVQRRGHGDSAQPRVMRLPEGEVLLPAAGPGAT
ncbi:hypothetical protein Agub_g5089 [Astrephomene gubernaculifera]|uniref:Calcineurin-like phosphoesterase domain-containing protein n=1 Tax=Astrephomene gubernaculifera TaxID=47775 RepID=A0AAD3DLA7_9CHLO|nr:hypothetical protein Agub_g5089 [Astrephomene gubernaculifera]